MKPAAFSRTAPFDPRFVERSALFWPVARAALALCGPQSEGSPLCPLSPFRPFRPFPAVESFGRVFDAPLSSQRALTGDSQRALTGDPQGTSKGDPRGAARGAAQDAPPPVRFVASPPRVRPRRGRRREAIVVRDLYDARITLDRVVPTRPDSWHDLMNALVWGTFPRAKLALHARQHRAIAERIAPDARTLPPTRTRELDALALLDEGGVILPWGDASRPVVFGHAIYESLALGIPPAVVAGVRIDLADIERAEGTPVTIDFLPAIDAALARFIGDPARLQTPEGLSRIELTGA
ncbi:MAG TPA: DUF3025 domain-containing protein [Polyangiaceae bacterium]|nr:DUF3025 domain-containing protein [Polyangiaceae bacterium]